MEVSGGVLYVFVEIAIDIEHTIETLCLNFDEVKTEKTFYLMGTVQFNNDLYVLRKRLMERGFTSIQIP